jgi:hypothetical protein
MFSHGRFLMINVNTSICQSLDFFFPIRVFDRHQRHHILLIFSKIFPLDFSRTLHSILLQTTFYLQVLKEDVHDGQLLKGECYGI